MNGPHSAHRLDPALARGLTTPRRDFLKLFGAAGAGLAIAACGAEEKRQAQAKASPVEEFWTGKTRNGHVDFANWPLYMDPKRPELKLFTQRTGITVTYREVIKGNTDFFDKIQPKLAAGRSMGYDLFIISNSVGFGQLVDLGYLAPLDHSKMPNFTKYADGIYKNESFDPGNVYSVPWETGITGIAYNPKYVKEDVTGFASLFDRRYKGRVGMFSDAQEAGNFGMLALGVDPEKSTPADWQKAADKLQRQRDQGIVRKYYDQDYVEPLAKGEIWISQAWSGDIFQKNLEGAGLKFVIPREGGTIWTDSMVIPKTAGNPVDAIALMDFFYEPKIAASLAEYINYVTPVSAAKQAILQDAAGAAGARKSALTQLATSPLVFPSAADYARLRHYRPFKNPQEQILYDAIFQPVIKP